MSSQLGCKAIVRFTCVVYCGNITVYYIVTINSEEGVLVLCFYHRKKFFKGPECYRLGSFDELFTLKKGETYGTRMD